MWQINMEYEKNIMSERLDAFIENNTYRNGILWCSVDCSGGTVGSEVEVVLEGARETGGKCSRKNCNIINALTDEVRKHYHCHNCGGVIQIG